MQPGTSAKSHWINYILLWKNEIYSGKTILKSGVNHVLSALEPGWLALLGKKVSEFYRNFACEAWLVTSSGPFRLCLDKSSAIALLSDTAILGRMHPISEVKQHHVKSRYVNIAKYLASLVVCTSDWRQ